MTAPFSVFAEAFSRDGGHREIGEFAAYDAALKAATARIIDDLFALFDSKQSAKELFDQWTMFGDDVFIVPDDETTPFSAMDFARLMVLQITRDDSRPLWLEVTCTDCLNFASGFSSPPKQWIFYVKAPATYGGATHLIRRATELLYREMSLPALQSEGSRYSLLDLTTRELSEAEFAQASPDQTVYVVQNDGTFVKEA